MVVRFPSGNTDTHINLIPDSLYTLIEGSPIIIDTSDTTTSVRETLEFEEKIDARFYPNPTQRNMNIEFTDAQQRRLRLFDTKGILIDEKSIIAKSMQYSTTKLPNGIYIIQVQQGNLIQHFRIVKQ